MDTKDFVGNADIVGNVDIIGNVDIVDIGDIVGIVDFDFWSNLENVNHLIDYWLMSIMGLRDASTSKNMAF